MANRKGLGSTLLVLLLTLFMSACGSKGASDHPPSNLAVPTGLVALGGDGQVALSWNLSANATTYHVKRAAHTGGPYTQITESSTNHFADLGRPNGTACFYVVSAVYSGGESANSSEATATPTPGLPTLPASDPTKNLVGLGVWFLNDWDNSFAFVDAMKHARPWQDASDWNKPVGGIDALGWPTADASTVIYTGTPAQVNGTHKLVFNGQADISLMWTSGTVSNPIYDAASNTTTADVTFNYGNAAGGSLGLAFKNTKRTATSATNSGFTNARLYKPGYPTDGSKIFTTPFLAALSKASVVRMMDWTFTNQNLVQHWADRMTPLHMSKAGLPYTGPGGSVWKTSTTGVALEHQIQLANALHSDCWINIPVVADDDYVQKLAQALRYGTDGTTPYTSTQANPVYPPLDPTLRIYLEYGNEIWNSAGGFDGFGVIQDIVSSLPANHPLLYPAESSIWYKMWRYPAYRTATISDTFRAVYGDASMMNRIRPIVMTQQGNGQATLQQALAWLDSYGQGQSPARTVDSYLYGAGGSGYYGVNQEPANHADLNAYFATGNYPATQNVKGMGVDAVWAANYGLKRIAYEGGPSLDSFTDAEARAINADPRMQDMIVKTHDAWSNQGGDLLVYYTLVGPPKWEFTPDITRTDAPKLKGLDQLAAQPRAAVTLGQALPGAIIAADQPDYRIRTGYDYPATIDGLACVAGNDAGEWIALSGHTSASFTGNVSVNGSANAATTIKVWINGVAKGQVTLTPGSHLTDSTSLSAVIPAGLVVIRLEILSGGFNLRSITVN
jgi:predicted small lipoprotein YifL